MATKKSAVKKDSKEQKYSRTVECYKLFKRRKIANKFTAIMESKISRRKNRNCKTSVWYVEDKQ